MALLRSRIAGVGSFLPPRVVHNDELAAMMDTSDEWIRQRTGIETRHWVEGETSTSDLALEASKKALDDAGVAPEELDMVVLATLSPDHEFPGTACFLQAKLGIAEIPALDVRQQCSGFVYACSIADQYIRTGTYRKILVVGAEVHSKGLDRSTEGRDVAVLFGDGAGAVVLQACEIDDPTTQPHILSTHLHADGRFAKELWIEAPSQTYEGRRIGVEDLERGAHFPHMNGRLVFVHATRRMPEAVREACDANGLSVEDIDLFLFHQANLRINEAVGKQLKAPPEKVFHTVQRFANTTAATIPIGLDTARREGVVKPGMLVVGSAFGSGFTWCSMLFRW